MSTIVAIKGTNGSGKSTAVRLLLEHLGTQAKLRFNHEEAGYRCKYGERAVFVLGKYRSSCGGLDSSFSYRGAAEDVLMCLGALAGKGHVVCEGVIAITSYGFGRVARFADEQKAKGNNVIFARIDTPAELCIERVRRRRRESGNYKPFNPEKLLVKYESVMKSQKKLLAAGYDARTLPHDEPFRTLLRWLKEQHL